MKTKGFFRKEEFYYLLLTAYFFLHNLIYIALKHMDLINSDASAEMILADHLNKVGGFLSREWFYSSELRVLNTQFVYKLALGIFPHNWHLARTFSVGLFMLLLIAAVWYLMWAIGRKEKGFLAAAIIICPFGKWYAWNVLYNSYYVPHIVISLVTLALFCHIRKAEKKTLKIILTTIMAVLSFVAGCGGLRQLMVCFAPLWIACLLLFLANIRGKEKRGLLIHSSIVLVGGFCGYLLNAKVLAKIFSFKDYNETIWQEFSLSSVWMALEQLLRQFGWVNYTKVFSLAGIGNFICIFLIVGIIAGFIIQWKRVKEMGEGEQILLCFTTCAFALMLFVFSGTWVYNESYWLPLVPFLFLPLLFSLQMDLPKFRGMILVSILALGLVIYSLSSRKNPYIGDVPNDEKVRKAAEFLKNQDEYTQGIAEFWSAPVVTELTDGKIEMWTVEDYVHLEPSTWLQPKSHMEMPAGKVFILIPCATAAEDPYRMEELGSKIIYNDGNYLIYGLNHYMEYYNAPSAETGE